MNTNKKILFLLAGAILLTSCATSKKDEIQAGGSNTSKAVQQVIDDLGLVYVEDGANSIITYDEVNAAQQAWCDALVKIGKLKEEGGDYKAYAEKVLSEAYNYDYGKVFFKPTLAFGDQTFRNTKKGALALLLAVILIIQMTKVLPLHHGLRHDTITQVIPMKVYKYMVRSL